MAAVLTVALLLLCSSVRSSAQGVQGTITQVLISDSPTTAPAITNTTEGSSDSQSAVLAKDVLRADDSGPLVSVDLARSDQENMTSMIATPPTSDSVPSGFDMSEADDANPESFSESTTPPALDAIPPGLELDDDSHSPAPTHAEGTLVPGFPGIGSSVDNSHGSGYGVRAYDESATAEDDSLFAVSKEDPPLATIPDQGTLVSGFPRIGSSIDSSQGSGNVFQTYDESATIKDDSSFAVSKEDPPLATIPDQGTLVSGFPRIGSSIDSSQGSGNVFQTYDESATIKDDSSFAVSKEDPPLATIPDQGTLVSGFPRIGSSIDSSQGSGNVFQTYDESATIKDDSSFAVSKEDPPLATIPDQGTLVSGFPRIGSSIDNSQESGNGDQTYDAPAREGDALAVYGEEVPDPTENYTLNTSRTYRPMPPKPAPAEAWRKGRCTYYGGMDAAGTMSGACGYGNLYASGYGVYTAALSAKLFNNGMACGACYEVACSGKGKPCKAGSIVVTATNFCPPNPGLSANSGGWCNPPNEHFDLSYPAFTKIADPKAGIVPLQFRRVPCKNLGGIRFTLNGNCNFNLVTITNVGGSGVVIEVYMKGDYMPWASLSRNWGANWQSTRNYCGKAISIKIVTSDKKVAVSELAGKDWAFGQTYVGQQVK